MTQTIEQFSQLYQHATLPNNAWSKQLRAAAMNDFENIGLPAIKNENWKYTRSNLFLKDSFEIAQNLIEIPAEKIQAHVITQGDVIVFIDGIYAPQHSRTSFVTALKDSLDQPLVQAHLNTIAAQESGFMTLNTALMQDGAVIHITGIVEHPIQILHLSSGKQRYLNHARHLIICESSSEASVITSYVSLDDHVKYFNNVVTEILLQDNARLNCYALQNESMEAQHLSSTYVRQQRDSYLHHVNIDLGSKISRHWLQTQLIATNAGSNFDGFYLVSDEQHIDNHTRVEHLHSHTMSQEYYKGIIAKQGRAVFNGQVLITQDSQKVRAEQHNANLLLDPGATVDTKPQLEIYADDVKCSHGATIGQLDTEALFYLTSRGLNEKLARDLLLYGFAHELFEKITCDTLQDYLTAQLLTWLPNGKQLTTLL